MDFRIETKELQKVVGLIGVTARVNAYDFSGQVLIEANDDNTVRFISNNNSTAISILSSEGVTVNSPGSAVIYYGKLKPFVNAFSAWDEKSGTKDFHLVKKGDVVKVYVGIVYKTGEKSKGDTKLDSLNDAYFKMPKPFGESQFILNSNMFKKAASKVIYAMDTSGNMAFARGLHGMNLSFRGEGLFFCGTDGRVLSEYKVENSSGLEGTDYLIQYDFVMGLKRAVGEETQIFFEIDESDIRAKFDNVCISGRLVTGDTFPNYKPVLDVFEKTMIVSKEAIMGSITPFLDLLDNEDHNRLTFEIKDNKVKLSSDTTKFECDFGLKSSDEFVIDINGKLLYQTIEAINDDKIMIKFTDDNGVFIFDSGNFEDQKALITPIRRR